MSSLESLTDHDLMERPRPKRCEACGAEMVVESDRATGEPVRTGGRALLRCPKCGDLSIGVDHRRAMRRYRLIATIGGVAVFLGFLFEIGWSLAEAHAESLKGNTSLLLRVIVALGIGFFSRGCLMCVARALSPGLLGPRLHYLILALYWAAPLGLLVYLAIWKLRPPGP